MQTIKIITPDVETPETEDLGCPQDVPCWYVIRVTYGRERKLGEALKAKGILYFLPTKTIHSHRPADGKHIKKVVSVIPNLIFVYITRAHMQALKEEMEKTIPLRYLMDRNTKQPMTIRQRQMEDFIRVAGSSGDNLMYLDNPDVVLQKGQLVEVTFGPFKGVRGYVLRIRRDRKVVLLLEGLLAAAIKAEIKTEWLRKIEE